MTARVILTTGILACPVLLGSLSCNYVKNILRQVMTITLAPSWCITVSSLRHRLLPHRHASRCPNLRPKTLPWCIPLLPRHSTKLAEEYLFCIRT
ncbi:hypothetical protein EV401DRAFT_1917154 [Pisolithus croceorrhizus]|nr:hypothetical protein EV401DRAFT_1917154 [Pisolithus croceorrhizus]